MASRCQLKRQSEHRVARFNAEHPLGSPVVVLRESADGRKERIHTRTSSAAWVCGRHPVVHCDAFHSEIHLDHIEVPPRRVVVVTPDGASGVVQTELSIEAVRAQVAQFFGRGTQVAYV